MCEVWCALKVNGRGNNYSEGTLMNNLWKLHIYRTMLIRDIIKEKLFTHVCLPNYFRFVQWNWTCPTVCTFFSPQYSPCQYDLCLWKKTSFYKFFVSIKSIILTYSWYHELMNWWENQEYLRENCTVQKMKFPIKDFFSKYHFYWRNP